MLDRDELVPSDEVRAVLNAPRPLTTSEKFKRAEALRRKEAAKHARSSRR